MNCGKFRKLIYDYLDNRLSGSEKDELVSHINSCASCQKLLALSKKSLEIVDNIPVVEPEENLNEMIFKVLQKEQERRKSFLNILPEFICRPFPALAAVAFTMILVIVLKLAVFPVTKEIMSVKEDAFAQYSAEEKLFIAENLDMLENISFYSADMKLVKNLELVEFYKKKKSVIKGT